jgi:hypothetical protein
MLDDDKTAERRISRQELYERVWATPMRRLATEFSLSDVGLAKLCHRHAIPTPPRGYWMKSEDERCALRRPLGGGTANGDDVFIHAATAAPRSSNGTGPRRVPITVVVPSGLVNTRSIVSSTVRSLRHSRRDLDGLVAPRAKNALPIRVGPDSIDRAGRLLALM